MRRIAFIVLVVAAVAVVPPITATAGESKTSAPSVRVLDAGEQPREEVRFAPAPDSTQSLAMTVGTTIEQSGAVDSTFGPLDYRIPIEITPGALASDQTFPAAFAYGNIELLDSSEVDPEVLEQVRSNFEELAGITGAYTFSTTGAIVDGTLDIPEDVDSSITQLLEQFEQQANQLAVPLPEEPIGVGARWRVKTRLELVGIKTTQIYTYTLLERSGNRLEVGVRFTQKARRQGAELPGVPSSVDVTVTKYKVTGKGTATVDLSLTVPAESSLRASGVQNFRATDGKDTEEISQQITLRVDTEPG
jgi:hypothetical protein